MAARRLRSGQGDFLSLPSLFGDWRSGKRTAPFMGLCPPKRSEGGRSPVNGAILAAPDNGASLQFSHHQRLAAIGLQHVQSLRTALVLMIHIIAHAFTIPPAPIRLPNRIEPAT